MVTGARKRRIALTQLMVYALCAAFCFLRSRYKKSLGLYYDERSAVSPLLELELLSSVAGFF